MYSIKKIVVYDSPTRKGEHMERGYKHPYVKNLAIRNWECPNCKIIHDRDANAAMNILYKGTGLVA
jgi:transposase